MVGAGLAAAKRAAAEAGTPVQELLRVTNLRASYDGRQVLTDVSFSVGAGELVTLLGANGSGKSTALRCMVGLRPFDSGSITLDGTPLVAAKSNGPRRAAMVFQSPQLVKRMSVIDNVCTGALGRLGWQQSISKLLYPQELREEAMRCLERVGLADRAADRAGRLSGGQQQRVAIARALCQRAPLLLADEPVSALDPAATEQVLALLADLAHTDGYAILAVLHQPELARRYSDRLIGLNRGEIVFDAKPAKVTANRVAELYAQEPIEGARLS